MRRLHGARGRRTAELVPRAGGARRRRARDDDRRAARPPSVAARVCRTRRRTVRHLHAGDDPGRRSARSASDTGSDEDRPRRQSLPLHGLLGDLSIHRGYDARKKPQRSQRARRLRGFGHVRKKPRSAQRTQGAQSTGDEESAYKARPITMTSTDHGGIRVACGACSRGSVDFVLEALRAASGLVVQFQRKKLEPRRDRAKGQRFSRVSPSRTRLRALCGLRGFF